MGWTYTHVERGDAGNFFKKEFSCENEKVKLEVIQGAFVGWREYYAAVERTIKETGESYVFGVVCLVNYAPKSYHNFGYRDMDESMGPYAYHCPESILKLLTPTENSEHLKGNQGAKAWRIACWENVLNRKAVKKIKDGDTIKLAKPIHYTNGEDRDTFFVKLVGKKKRFCATSNSFYTHYKVPRNVLGTAQIIEKVDLIGNS